MPSNKTTQCLAFEHHDHQRCQSRLLSAAKQLCHSQNIRLTERREQVLQILLQSHQPMGAYEILGQLNQNPDVSMVAPPIVYRALEFLLSVGLVHRIECKNAFIGCAHPGHASAAQFLICKGCEKVAELDNPTTSLQQEASQVGFMIDHSVVEITGLCAECQADG
ncbi:MAG: transcriptional repressor [Gammaproteobacteria bacterium]|nr:transcriptional repressor [Gammaproteobacteria bacterium]